MIRLCRLTLVGTLLLLLKPASALAADTPPAEQVGDRPRVGLVLSGGGARGAAHIGVLRVLEELRVPVDCVAGASVGSIIGGLYASGMSPDEIEAAVTGLDWDAMFRDEADRKDRSFRRKTDDELLLVKANPGFDIKTRELKLPAGLSQGQRINLALRELTTKTAGAESFGDLATPFRAVATDLSTGQPVVLGDGNIADAMWASMAVPGVFAPANLDGRLLVDGGVTNNLPIDVARDMCAEVLIVVDISTPLKGPDEITNLFSVTDQLTSIMTRANTERQLETLEEQDIQIVPEIVGVNTADFRQFAVAIPFGYEAADRERAALSRYSVSAAEYEVWVASRERRPAVPVIDFIQVRNNAGLDESALLAVVEHPLGAPLDIDQLDRDIALIYGTELFERVTWDINSTADQTGIVIDAEAKSWGPDFLQFGMDLEGSSDGDTLFNVRVAYLRTVRNFRGAEWRTGITVGQEPGIQTEWYQPVDRVRRYFVSPNAGYKKFSLNSFDGDDKVAEYRFTEAYAGLAVGRVLNNWGEIRLGYDAAVGDTDLRIGDPDLPTPDFNLGRVFTRLRVDTLSNAYFPTSGRFLQAEYRWHRPGFGDDESFDQLEVEAFTALSFGRFTVLPGIQAGKSMRGDTPFYALFRAGGFLRLSGFESNELSGQEYALATTVFYRRMNDITFLPIYVGGSAEYGAIGDDIDAGDGRAAGSLFLGVDSFFGPLYLGAGLAEGGNSSAYMFLGQRF